MATAEHIFLVPCFDRHLFAHNQYTLQRCYIFHNELLRIVIVSTVHSRWHFERCVFAEVQDAKHINEKSERVAACCNSKNVFAEIFSSVKLIESKLKSQN